jgi:ubiquinone biosynthesis protein
MHFTSLLRIERNARRLTEILAVLSKYGLADWLGGLNYEWLQGRLVSFEGERLGKLTREARIRLALTELGTTFIKLGQMLSTRPDVIGPELSLELGQLRSNAPPDPPGAVEATIAAEFGKPVDELFREFDAAPLASGSIGQVHNAVLPGGTRVVVKVQHADIIERIHRDLDIMAGLAELLQKHVAELRPYQPVATVREFRRVLLFELDFASERRNLEEFHRNFDDDGNVHFPDVFPEWCSRRVLTMERLEGISGEEPDALRQDGFDLEEFARRGADMYLKMIFRDGFYHADPHPGNLMMLPGGVVGVIDCGMVGRIDEHLREDIENVLLAVVEQDGQEMTDIVTRVGAVPPNLDHDALRSEISTFVAEYSALSAREVNVSEVISRATDIVRRYHILLPPPGALLLKTLMMLEGTSRQLNPTFSLAELIRPFGAMTLRRRLSPKRLAGKMRRAVRDWDRLLNALPRDLAEVLRRVRSGTFEIRHEHHKLEVTVNRLVLGILTAALFVGSSLMWSAMAPPAPWGVSIPGVVSFLGALVLGWRTVRAIGRSDQQ